MAIIRSIVPLNDEASDPRFAVELDAGGKCWQFQLGTWMDEHGLRVFSPQPHDLWMAFYAECTSISTPANVFRVVIRVQQGETIMFPLEIPDEAGPHDTA